MLKSKYNNLTKNNLLSYNSREILYNFLSFYDLSTLFPQRKLSVKQNNISFSKMLRVNSCLQSTFTNNTVSLIRAKVVSVNNSFLYLDLGSKVNLVKPKFKNNIYYILNKEFLFSFDKFYNFCNFFAVRQFLQLFQYRSIKLEKFFSIPHRNCLKVLIENSCSKLGANFFFLKLRQAFFSNYQKKINFLQFNVFFKKYKY